MGLGKTFQVCALLTCLMRNELIQRVLILCPVSVLHNWMRELNDHVLPYVRRLHIDLINSDITKQKRSRHLTDVFLSRSCRIVVSSYQLVSNMIQDFAKHGLDSFIHIYSF